MKPDTISNRERRINPKQTQQQNNTLPAEPAPFISHKQPEMNPLSFEYKGIDSDKNKFRRNG